MTMQGRPNVTRRRVPAPQGAHRVWRLAIGAIAGVGLLAAGLMLIYGVRLLRDRGLGAEAMPGPSAAAPAAAAVTAVTSLPSEPFDLEIDPSGPLWFVSMSISEPDYLYRMDTVTRDIKRWETPELTHNGLGSQVRVDATGGVWFFAAYDLVRFDSKSETMGSVHFAVEAEGAAPAGTDGNYPDPGTYLTAVLPAGDGALIARNNVPYLTRLDSKLSEIGRVPLPDGYAGATGLAVQGNGSILLAMSRQLRSVAQIDLATGQLKAQVAIEGMTPQAHLEASADSFLVTSSTGGAIRSSGVDAGGTLSPGSMEQLLPVSDVLDLSQAAIGSDGSVLVYDYPSAAFVWFRGNGSTVVHKLQIEDVTVTGPGGEKVAARTIPEVLDVAIDPTGVAWYVVGGHLTLYAIEP